MSIEEMEKEFDPRTWQEEPFGLLLAESIALIRLNNAEATGDKDKIADAQALYAELLG